MIAFAGLGLLGANFVRAFIRRGETVQVWNRSFEKARAMEAEGAQPFERIEDAVRGVARLHVCLSDDAAVDDVLERARPGLTKETFIVDHTTTSPAGTAARAARMEAAGLAYLHAPVFMGPPNALDATGIMMAAGPRARFDQLAPSLEKMTGKLIFLGEEPNRAAVFKLLGNLMLIEMMSSVADVFTLAKAAGVAPADALQLFEFFNPASFMPPRAKRMLDAKFEDASFSLEMARKDVRLMLETVAHGHGRLINLPGVAGEMDLWLARGHAKQDWTIIAKDAVKKE